MGIELYIRPRTSPSDDRRTGALANGRVRLTAVDTATGKTLFTEELEDADVTIFVDELPTGLRRPKGSSPERDVGPVPRLPQTEGPALLEGRPGLGRAASRVPRPAEGHEDADEPATPASVALRGTTGTRKARKAR